MKLSTKELVRQKCYEIETTAITLKYALFFLFVICSQTLFRYKVELFYAAKNKITRWMNVFFFQYFSCSPPKKKRKVQNGGCTHVVSWYGMTLWVYLILLTKGQFHTRSDISKKMKIEHICQTIDSSITIVVSN